MSVAEFEWKVGLTTVVFQSVGSSTEGLGRLQYKVTSGYTRENVE